MKFFKDSRERSWTIAINVLTVERVQAKFSLHLPSLFNDRLRPFAALLGNESKFVEVIYELGREYSEKAGLIVDDLKREFCGEVADRAEVAFKEDLIDFFRDPQRRTGLRQALAEIEEIGKTMLAKGLIRLDKVAKGMDAEIEKALNELEKTSANTATDSSGNTPESSASIQGPSLSNSSL